MSAEAGQTGTGKYPCISVFCMRLCPLILGQHVALQPLPSELPALVFLLLGSTQCFVYILTVLMEERRDWDVSVSSEWAGVKVGGL